MKASEKLAKKFAKWLEKHDFIEKDTFQALKSHTQRDLEKKQMKISHKVFCTDCKRVKLA